MKKGLFREKNLQKLSTPDALNEYIKVANPSIWLIMVTVTIILVGIIIWAYVGNLSISEKVMVYSDGTSVTCYVPEEEIDALNKASHVSIDEKDYNLGKVPSMPEQLSDSEIDSYIAHVLGISSGAWVYKVTVSGDIPEGIYSGELVEGKVRPISYVIN